MEFTIHTKDFSQTKVLHDRLDKKLHKLLHVLDSFNTDKPNLSVEIHRHRNRHYFDGSLQLKLPKKTLIAHFREDTVGRSINAGFDRLFEEIKTYKAKHFSSEAPHHSIRKRSRPVINDIHPKEIPFSSLRDQYIESVLKPRDSIDTRVIEAFRQVPREEFVLPAYKMQAYEDIALPIEAEQTISQPSLVVQMTAMLALSGNEKVLEIGTGSGYQAAILSRLAKDVYTVERIKQLATKASKRLKRLGFNNVYVHTANGSLGLPLYAPYDAIIVTAGAQHIPQPLIDQLKEHGRIVIPVGISRSRQRLVVGMKINGTVKTLEAEPVQFVPLIGEYGRKEDKV